MKVFQLNLLIVSILGFIILGGCAKKQEGIQPVQLQCESLTDPLGIDEVQPELSWKLISDQPNQKQSAYRILVASSKEKLAKNQADLWDSKKINSEQSVYIEYKGQDLKSKTECYWKVKVWDKNGRPSDWSKPAKWSMGLLDREDWQAKWIGTDKRDKYVIDTTNSVHGEIYKTKLPARYLRKELKIDKEIKNAYAYISGLGLYELFLNGQKVSDYVLAPAQTQFDERVLYNTFDVTEYIKKDKNAIGVILGNGRYFPMRMDKPFGMRFFGFPKLLFHLDIEFKDGSHKIVTSNEEWKVTNNGPIVDNNEYDGEVYDARKKLFGWNQPGYDDGEWSIADIVEKPGEHVSAQMNEPIRITQEIVPKSINQISPDTFIVDMGQNMVGWVEINVKGERGDKIHLTHAEALDDRGRIDMANIRSAEAHDIYICNGKESKKQTWEPRFTYHGFRYVEVVGFPGKLTKGDITGKVIHDDLDKIGNFTCSSDVINRTYRNAVWGIRGNYRSFPTDCPQRDEKMAWLGDRATGSRGESYIFDIKKLYEKWLQDIDDAQLESGSISDVSPAYWQFYNDNVTWDGAPIILTDMLYDQYGDKEVIAKYYDFLKDWITHMTENYMRDGIMPRDNYGDWCVPPKEPETIHTSDIDRLTEGNYLGTAFFYYQTNLMKNFAKLLNKNEDVEYFNQQANKIKKAFNRTYFNKNQVTYSNNTATASILALTFGLVDQKYEEEIFQNLVQKIEVQHDGHIPVGVVGAQFLMRTLSKYGRPDIAYRFATQTDYPSWGYMAEQGATTIWELWNGNTADPAMNSRNHVMLLGDLIIWFYENLAGIKPVQEAPGFKKIIMKPYLIEGLNHVTAHHNSPYGKIGSEWEIKNNQFTWNIIIPVNTTAKVHIPARNKSDIFLDGKPVKNVDNVKFAKQKGDYIIFKLGSGDYEFSTREFIINKDLKGTRAPLPKIEPGDTTAPRSVKIRISCPSEDADIYYTTDGSTPNKNSKLYEGPFIVREPAKLRVKCYKENLKPSFENSAFIDVYQPEINGLNYTYYEGEWSKLPPPLDELKKVKTGQAIDIRNIKKIVDNPAKGFVVFSGFLQIDKKARYNFELQPEHVSWLKIKDELILDNKAFHQKSKAKKSIMLKPGKVPLELMVLGKARKVIKGIKLTYSAPGVPRQIIPISKLYIRK